MSLSSIPFTSIFSGITWGVLTTSHRLSPIWAKPHMTKLAEFQGEIISAIMLCFASRATQTGFVPRALCAIALSGSFVLSEYLKVKSRSAPDSLAKNVNRINGVFHKNRSKILLGLNIASGAVEMARGQIAYPLARLTVVLGIDYFKYRFDENTVKRQQAIMFLATLALSTIQPLRGVWSGISGACTAIAPIYKRHPHIYNAIAIATLINGSWLVYQINKKKD